MSAQWEVVGKSNKKLNVPTKKLTKTEKKKFVESAPKIEDILPLDQIRTLYNALDSKKENKQQQPLVVIEKKPKKKAPAILEKKEVVKEKIVPKTLEAAAKQVDVKELISVVELNQARFSDVPVLWVKGVAEYLNIRLAYNGTVPLLRPQDTFLSLLPAEARDVLHKALQRTGPAAMKHFFEHCLACMVTELSKGNNSVAGFKIILQIVAANSASGVLQNPGKVHSVWNSFQNNQPIGTTILWALGQLGVKDIIVGIKVWEQLMVPVLELRSYGGFVVNYLKMLSAIIPRGKPIPVDELTIVIDTVCAVEGKVPASLRKELHEAVAALLKKCLEVKPESRLRGLFQPLMERLSHSTPKPLEKELVSSLFTCLKLDSKCFSIWQKMYSNHIDASSRLLQYIRNAHWRDLSVKLLRDSLLTFQTANQDLMKFKDLSDTVKKCQTICEEILPKLKMTVARKTFPWWSASSLLVLAIAGALVLDIQRHGSFESSSTGLFLRDVGVLRYTKTAWDETKLISSKCASWAKENVPLYYQMMSETSGPYLQQGKAATLKAGAVLNETYYGVVTYIQEKAPIFEEWCDRYAPGLVLTVRTQIGRVCVLLQECVGWLGQVGSRQSQLVINWAKTNVFVGSLSPEKLQQFSIEALNATQEYALWTYQWVVEKYHAVASVQ